MVKLRRIVPDVVSDQTLVALTATDFVRDAARLMKHRRVGSVLVMDGDTLSGIFTERDMVYRVVADGLDPDMTPLSQVMTPNPDTIDGSASALDALRAMNERGYRHLPVIENGRVVGIVSRRDFYGEEKAEEEKHPAADDQVTQLRN
ncbi:MAG: CBS domain-containing protein [Proteobacteria bacterium]|nr:CBS domain-containing protein [Pseudomonadota bacterium]MDA1057782.1 CBS domain-containing protein [Pseudomonadota bacterium]